MELQTAALWGVCGAALAYIVKAALEILRVTEPDKAAKMEAKILGPALAAMRWVDNIIPDTLADSDDKMQKMLAKANAFAKYFVQNYERIHGEKPTAKEVTAAKNMVEVLLTDEGGSRPLLVG